MCTPIATVHIARAEPVQLQDIDWYNKIYLATDRLLIPFIPYIDGKRSALSQSCQLRARCSLYDKNAALPHPPNIWIVESVRPSLAAVHAILLQHLLFWNCGHAEYTAWSTPQTNGACLISQINLCFVSVLPSQGCSQGGFGGSDEPPFCQWSWRVTAS